jgi:hypothetical protein
MESQTLRYFAHTHTQFSHNHLIALLSSRDIKYRFIMEENEETWSRFEITSLRENFEWLREVSKENNGTSFTIEYGVY